VPLYRTPLQRITIPHASSTHHYTARLFNAFKFAGCIKARAAIPHVSGTCRYTHGARPCIDRWRSYTQGAPRAPIHRCIYLYTHGAPIHLYTGTICVYVPDRCVAQCRRGAAATDAPWRHASTRRARGERRDSCHAPRAVPECHARVCACLHVLVLPGGWVRGEGRGAGGRRLVDVVEGRVDEDSNLYCYSLLAE
jgi:hypothetical protein